MEAHNLDPTAIGLLGSLHNETCCLNHGPKDLEPHQAVDLLTIPMGYKEKGIKTEDLSIAVCEDCIQGLEKGSGWILLFCITCCASQWIYKPLSRKPFTGKVKLMDECPKCLEH